MRSILRVALCCLLLQAVSSAAAAQPAPRLIVFIVLDQFPYEYITRFRAHLSTDGIVRLMNNGATFTNMVYAHANTSTGPGHAVLSTGAYGTVNGIVGNSWFDYRTGRTLYCVADSTVTIIGGQGQGRSPANLQTLTYGDELRIGSGFRSKVVSLSNKDRAAILLGGKYANIALWMRDSAMVSSTYYAPELPSWVRAFNASGIINSYFGRRWDRTLPVAAFAGMDKDDAPYESGENGMGVTFPHRITGNDTSRLTPSYYSALLTSPFGCDFLATLAKTAVREEHLGRRGVTDLLCVSFSSTDYVGLNFGPHSREMLELVVHVDRIIAEFLRFLDKEVGLAHCLIALSSDHAVSQIPDYLDAASGRNVVTRLSYQGMLAACETTLTRQFGAPTAGTKWIAGVYGSSITLSPATLAERNVTAERAAAAIALFLKGHHGIAEAYTRDDIERLVPFTSVQTRLKNSYLRSRSGDVQIALKPYHVDADDHKGATHGQPYESDAHVPLLLMGPGVKKGIFAGECTPADIAPTLSAMTGVEFTPGRQGRVLVEAMGN